MKSCERTTLNKHSKALAKTRVGVIVGAFSTSQASGIGGVATASQSLINSPALDFVEWHLIDSTVPMGVSPFKRTALALSRVIRLLYLIIKYPRIDIIFVFGNYELTSFLEKGILILLGKAFQKRTILSLRTQIRQHSYDSWFTPFRRWVLRSCDHIICQSNIAASCLSELTGCNVGRISVIMNWIDAQKYVPAALPCASTTALPDVVKFIFVGHLSANKAPDVLLQAGRILKDRGIPFHLIFCGDGPLRTQLEQDVKKFELTSQVEMRGWVVGDELVQALWEANVFVLPTHSEGMPNALLEAMAAGLPVITTRVSSIPEIVTEGENGFLVQPGSALELADAMQRMMYDPENRARMAEANMKRIQQNHSIEMAWRAIASILSVN